MRTFDGFCTPVSWPLRVDVVVLYFDSRSGTHRNVRGFGAEREGNVCSCP